MRKECLFIQAHKSNLNRRKHPLSFYLNSHHRYCSSPAQRWHASPTTTSSSQECRRPKPPRTAALALGFRLCPGGLSTRTSALYAHRRVCTINTSEPGLERFTTHAGSGHLDCWHHGRHGHGRRGALLGVPPRSQRPVHRGAPMPPPSPPPPSLPLPPFHRPPMSRPLLRERSACSRSARAVV